MQLLHGRRPCLLSTIIISNWTGEKKREGIIGVCVYNSITCLILRRKDTINIFFIDQR